MTAFTFVGDPRHGGHGPDTITILGHTFKKGEAMEIKCATPELTKWTVEKLQRHNHFKEGSLDRRERAAFTAEQAKENK